LLENDLTEVSEKLSNVSSELDKMKELVNDISAVSNAGKINELASAYREVEKQCAFLSQIKFFDEILNITKWTD
jgi:uncharacterized coiled-coil DUF342 family protein